MEARKFDVSKVEKPQLIEAIQSFNKYIPNLPAEFGGLKKVRFVGVKLENMIEGFVDTINTIPADVLPTVDFPEKVVNMYEYIANNVLVQEEIEIKEEVEIIDKKITEVNNLSIELQPELQKEIVKKDIVKEVQKIKKKVDEYGFGKHTKNHLFVMFLKKHPGTTMNEVRKCKWNEKKITFYKVFKKLMKKDLAYQESGKLFLKD